MNVSWIFSFFLLIQNTYGTDSLMITANGQPVTTVNRSDYSMAHIGLPIIDPEKYNLLLEKLDRLVYKEPRDAYIDKKGNILPEKVGYQLYKKAFLEKFYSYFFNNGPSYLEIPLLAVYPRVDSEVLADISSKRIGRYITSFNAQNKTRSNNIRLAVEAINNSVIFPGESFSFNQVVGKRTEKKGYLRAPVIIRGELSQDIGGGICQVSSTLFNAVDNAGLQIIQRFSHSREVPYIPKGRDATVSWYGPDFVFKNKYNQPILIQAKTLGNKLIIKIFSSDVIEYKPKVIPNP
ncbi:MAG: VanW family protein [Bacillota bacterium]|nr:VanW family protein [Bacillota bacterium]